MDDRFFSHPKTLKCSKDAKLLFLCGLTYCAANMTDGFIPDAASRVLIATIEAEESSIEELISVRYWLKTNGGYQVKDYLEYNPSKAQREEERRKTAERVAAWRSKQQSDLVTPLQTPLVTLLVTPLESESESESEKESLKVKDSSSKSASRLRGFERFWSIYPSKIDKKDAQAVWQRINPDEDEINSILKGIENAKTSKRWREGFVMGPAKFLRGEHWNDDWSSLNGAKPKESAWDRLQARKAAQNGAGNSGTGNRAIGIQSDHEQAGLGPLGAALCKPAGTDG